MQILIAAGILGALGLVFGGIIFIASKYLSVPTDPTPMISAICFATGSPPTGHRLGAALPEATASA